MTETEGRERDRDRDSDRQTETDSDRQRQTETGAAAEHAATLKKQKYAALSQTHEFVPLAIETSGAYNSEGLDFVKKIGSRISDA